MMRPLGAACLLRGVLYDFAVATAAGCYKCVTTGIFDRLRTRRLTRESRCSFSVIRVSINISSSPLSLTHADRVVIAMNPTAGRNSPLRRVEQLVAELQARGLTTEVLTDLDAVAVQAAQLFVQQKLRALVSVGGDGTAAELVNRTPEGLPIAILPTGNENLLARYLGLKPDAAMLAHAITAGHRIRLDAAKANGRIFLLMLSCGFDAEVVYQVHARRRRGHVCHASYVRPILSTLRTYQYPKFLVHWESCADEVNRPNRFSARWLFVSNLPCYGGGLPIAARANGRDGLLDICAVRNGALFGGLCYLGAMLLRQQHRLPDYATYRATRLRIEADTPVRYQLDGDPGGLLPVEVRTLPGRLTLFATEARIKQLGAMSHVARQRGHAQASVSTASVKSIPTQY
jgi:diacylglycerol kinase (ATP)